MRIQRLGVTVVALCMSVACTPQPQKADIARETGAVRKRTSDWFAAERRRDMDASLSFLAPDAVIQPGCAPTITGASAVRQFYEEFFKAPFTDVVMEPRSVVLPASGDLAYDIGPWKMIFDGPQGRTEAPGKSTIIWSKASGQWRAVVMAFSMDTPAAPASK
jgi:ketosteroid isomerase-like protein